MADRPRISIVGAGNVGAAGAAAVAMRRLGDVYLYDIVKDLAVGKAMDINQAGVFFHSDSRVTGCDRFDELADSEVVVVAAGAPRRAGMRRRDLLRENLGVLRETAANVMRFCPQAVILVVTNPAEILTSFVKEQWPEARVFGLGCSLDTVRFRFFLAESARTSIDSVNAIVIGSHDDNMIPLVRHATVGGAQAERILPAEQLERIVAHTRRAGAAIVGKLKTRGSWYAASHCIAEIVEAIIRDTRGVFPLGVCCRGEFGYDGVCLALPCAVGSNGIEKVLEIDLDDEERAALDICARTMRDAGEEVRITDSDRAPKG